MGAQNPIIKFVVLHLQYWQKWLYHGSVKRWQKWEEAFQCRQQGLIWQKIAHIFQPLPLVITSAFPISFNLSLLRLPFPSEAFCELPFSSGKDVKAPFSARSGWIDFGGKVTTKTCTVQIPVQSRKAELCLISCWDGSKERQCIPYVALGRPTRLKHAFKRAVALNCAITGTIPSFLESDWGRFSSKSAYTEDKLSGLKNYIHKSLKMAEAMPKATSAGYAEGLMMDAGDGV